MKRILIVTQYIYPENFKSNDLMFELAARGYKVDVLTGIPNYPEGVYYKGYGLFKKRIEKFRNITIFRCLQLPRGRKSSAIKLFLNYMSFCLFGCLWVVFFFAWKKKYDAIIVHEPSPITQLIPACLLGILRKTQVYSWIMDIWPDSIRVFVGEKLYRYIAPALSILTEWTYNHTDKILITSKGFARLISRKKDYNNKIVYFPNWSADMSKVQGEILLPSLPKGFRIMCAGNIGEGQDVQSICNCILKLKSHTEIKWIFVGDGSQRHLIEEFIEHNDMSDSVYLLGKFPAHYMPSLYYEADALFVSLRGGYDFLDLTVPARVQSYMSASKPILAMLGEGGRQLIQEAQCGYCVPSGNYIEMASLIETKVLPDKLQFSQLGLNGRKYYEEYFTLNKCIDNLECILNS